MIFLWRVYIKVEFGNIQHLSFDYPLSVGTTLKELSEIRHILEEAAIIQAFMSVGRGWCWEHQRV